MPTHQPPHTSPYVPCIVYNHIIIYTSLHLLPLHTTPLHHHIYLPTPLSLAHYTITSSHKHLYSFPTHRSAGRGKQAVHVVARSRRLVGWLGVVVVVVVLLLCPAVGTHHTSTGHLLLLRGGVCGGGRDSGGRDEGRVRAEGRHWLHLTPGKKPHCFYYFFFPSYRRARP